MSEPEDQSRQLPAHHTHAEPTEDTHLYLKMCVFGSTAQKKPGLGLHQILNWTDIRYPAGYLAEYLNVTKKTTG